MKNHLEKSDILLGGAKYRMFRRSWLVKNLGFKKNINLFEIVLEALLYLSCLV